MTPFTESLNPIKLWEYLAAGQPIVSTDVAGFRDYPDFVRIGADPRAFLTACHAALQEDPSVGQQRRRSAEGHSWSERVDVIENVIHDCLSRRAGGVVSDRHQPDHRPALHVSPTVNSRA
jgi:teichuronic acid biosynthesis glycosyltransferase TuaH